MALRDLIRTPFNEGGGSSALVPKPWDCAIGGRTYMYDWKFAATQQFRRSSIELLKPQQDTGTVGERSLNPADGIRAAIESWHKGAGQVWLDRAESDPYRFRSSKGVNPWNRHKLSLHYGTDQKRSSANTNLALVPAGSRLYLVDGQSLLYTTDVTVDTPTWTTVTSTPAVAASGLASDGYYVWVPYGASGMYATNTGTGAAAQLVTTALDANAVVGYAKGRLMVGNGASLYNVTTLTGSAALPAVLYTHPNVEFTWVGFAEGQNAIYAAGYSGDKTQIFRVGIKTDGSGLDAPIVAGVLPDGEIVRTVGSYLGLVLIGTDRGVWVADQDTNGNLTVNKVLDLTSACRCFEGQGDFVWFGWTNYDSTSSGLGRMDLRTDTKGASVLTPAYASDLMVTAQGAVLSVVTFQDIRVFTVSGSGVWGQATSLVASGTIDSGWLTHGMPDGKVALTVSIAHEPLDGTVTVSLSTDEGTFTNLGTSSIDESTLQRFNAGSVAGEKFEVRHLLTRDATVTLGPVLTRSTLESNAAPGRGEFLNVPLLFFESLNVGGGQKDFDCVEAFNELLDIETSGIPTTYQDVLGAVTVTLEDHDFIIEGLTERRDAYVGTFLAKFRRPRRS